MCFHILVKRGCCDGDWPLNVSMLLVAPTSLKNTVIDLIFSQPPYRLGIGYQYFPCTTFLFHIAVITVSLIAILQHEPTQRELSEADTC
jgi:hypothetical protein